MTRALAPAALFLSQLGFAQHSLAPPHEDIIFAVFNNPGPSVCAGINRHEGEEETALRERSSEPLGPEFCAALREGRGEA
jgi:hypothetical protein